MLVLAGQMKQVAIVSERAAFLGVLSLAGRPPNVGEMWQH